MKRLLVGNYTGVWTGQLVALSSLGKWQQTLLSVQILRLQKSTSNVNFYYSYTFSFAQWTCGSAVLLNLSVCFAVLPDGQERWFGAHIYGNEHEL